MKHAAAPIDSAAENVQSIIVDVLSCIYQPTQRVFVNQQGQPNDKSVASGANIENDNIVDCETVANIPKNNGSVLRDASIQVNKENSTGHGVASGSIEANISQTDLRNHTRLQVSTHQNDITSNDTEIVPSSRGDCSSAPDSAAETVKATTSSNSAQDHFDSSNCSCSVSLLFNSNILYIHLLSFSHPIFRPTSVYI
jgi:hypothetical protein